VSGGFLHSLCLRVTVCRISAKSQHLGRQFSSVDQVGLMKRPRRRQDDPSNTEHFSALTEKKYIAGVLGGPGDSVMVTESRVMVTDRVDFFT
jgi:hypothetical protein